MVQMRDLSEASRGGEAATPATPSTPLRSSLPAAGAGFGPSVAQSWHAGGRSSGVLPPKFAASRSFAFGSRDDYRRESLLEEPHQWVELSLPTPEHFEALGSFSATYKQQHKRKPHVVAFVNSRSGGQVGRLLMKALTQSIGKGEDSTEAFTGEVCDLSLPEEPENTIETIAAASDMQRKLLVCGGDGTVTWILTALEQCTALQGKLHLLPVAIVPLGTGNDLARSLGWGGNLRAVSDILKYLRWVAKATPVFLDQWRLVLRPHAPLPEDHKLHSLGSHPQLVDDAGLSRELLAAVGESLGDDGLVSDAAQARTGPGRDIYLGFWQNYFSVGMDARTAGGVDRSRNQVVGRCCFRRGCGKFCYGWQGLRHALWARLLTKSLEIFSVAMPSQEALLNRRTVLSNYRNSQASSGSGGRKPPSPMPSEPPLEDFGEQLRELNVQGRRGRMRQLMLVNINSYAAGLNVLREGSLLAPPSARDGILEVLAVRNLLSTVCMFSGCSKPAYLASATRVALRLKRGEWMQLDGEPWCLDAGCDVLVERHRSVTMLCAPPDAPWWSGHVNPGYWGAPTSVPECDSESESS